MIIRPNWARKVCYMILPIEGPVDWEGGPVDWEGGPGDWRAWETWMGDIGNRGRGCVSLESERKGKEMSRLNTYGHTDRHVNKELEFRVQNSQ